MTAVVAGVLLASACSTNGLASLPLPAPGLDSEAYTLTAVFTNALNLPARAKVKMGGADIGEVDAMEAKNYTAVTTLRIRSDVKVPVGSTAELRSATPLDDVFVSLKPPNNVVRGMPTLRDGDAIGIESTTAAATVESVLSSAAIVVNGGAARNLTNTLNGLGKAAGTDGAAFGDLIAQSNQLLGRLNTRSNQLDDALHQTSQLVSELNTRRGKVSDLMSAAGPATDTLANTASQVADLAEQVGAISGNLAKFPSLAGTDQNSRSVIADLNALSQAFNEVAMSPDTSMFALNRLLPPVLKITASSSFAGKVSVDRLALGSIPDIGYKGDPGLHGPKRYDWAKLVGSFKYTLWRLQERVVGKGPDAQGPPVRPSPTEPGVIEPDPMPTTPGGR